MKIWTIAAAGLAAAALALGTAQAQERLEIGKPAPAFTGTDTKGVTHNLADFKGKTVVLEWVNHDCPFVVKHYGAGNMQALQQQAKDAGVVWISIVSSAEGKQGYVTAEQANAVYFEGKFTKAPVTPSNAAAVILDPTGQIGQAYKAKTTPHMFVINGEGTLVYEGGIDSIKSSNPEDIAKADPLFKTAMEQVVAGQPVANPQTTPYGCSVKYSGS